MFNKQHIFYMIISFSLTILGLILSRIFIKKYSHKKTLLKIFAILTVCIHFSSLYVDFFTYGYAKIESPMILPIYPCNVLMWLLVICAFLKNDNSKIAKHLYEFTFYGGVICGIIGIVLNENFASNPTLLNWFSIKGLLSHSTMVFGSAFILVGKFIKINVSNCISVFLGLCLFLVDGYIINGLYYIFGLNPCNSMYLLSSPLPQITWFNTYTMGLIGLALVFVITNIVEFFTLQKDERFLNITYTKIFKLNIK